MNLNTIETQELGNSKYIDQDGWYNCRVVDAEQFISKSGGEGIKILFEHESSGKQFSSIHMFGNNIAMSKLKQIAEVCELSQEQMENFTPTFLFGRKALLLLKKNPKSPKYMNLWEVRPATTEVPF